MISKLHVRVHVGNNSPHVLSMGAFEVVKDKHEIIYCMNFRFVAL